MQQQIDVALLPDGVPDDADLTSTTAIVIDVLRATSVMAAAGHSGITEIQTSETIEAAMEIAASRNPRPLLCGERKCKRIPGFDLGNSPLEYTHEVVGEREMILTTTNGTLAIQRVATAKRLLAASFSNLTATIDAIQDEPLIQIVCAGTDGQVSREDVLLAGLLVERLGAFSPDAILNDSASIARSSWREADASGKPLSEQLENSIGGRNLIRVGYQADIARCAQVDCVLGIVERVSVDDPGTRSRPVFKYRLGRNT